MVARFDLIWLYLISKFYAHMCFGLRNNFDKSVIIPKL